MNNLEQMDLPTDVKELNNNQLKSLAEQIRQKIIRVTTKNGGHLASNLGMVETTLALYHIFDLPSDKLIFDVGHQCYAHKILSGRNEKFASIRTNGGISGFPDTEESEYDAFSVGHAGTSISAGIGYCIARDALKEDYTVICVVGDGALSNGLNLEALLSTNEKPKNFIVVINDNGMSISKNKNGFYQLISKGTTKPGYARSKRAIRKIFGNSFITRMLSRLKAFVKRIINKNNFFENYGFKYVGVVDGNDIKELVKIMKRVKLVAKDKAVILHVKTTKGKGHKKAEEQAEFYHGVSTNLKNESGTNANALGQEINSLIEKDSKVFAITAAMKDGTGLKQVEEKYPNNFIDVGIAEEYAVTLAAGMASGGLKPIVAVYSTFLQRAYDQILHDVCLQNLPVVFCLDRAGLVGADGKTHQGVFDLSYLTHIPNMSIFAPNSDNELKDVLNYAISLNAPVAIRYPKNAETGGDLISVRDALWRVVKKGEKINLLAVGPNMLKLAKQCADNRDGVGIISVRSIKPLDESLLDQIKKTNIITLEENSIIGGFGSLVKSFYLDKKVESRVISLGIKDKFVKHGNISDQLIDNGLSVENLNGIIDSLL